MKNKQTTEKSEKPIDKVVIQKMNEFGKSIEKATVSKSLVLVKKLD